jgi:hypothetical protein
MDDRDEEIRHTIFEGMRSGLGGSTQIKNTLLEKYIILPRASVEVVEPKEKCNTKLAPYSICGIGGKNCLGKDCKIKRIYIERE